MAHDPKLVEAVARALGVSIHGDEPVEWEETGQFFQQGMINDATAALGAIVAAGCVVVPREDLEQAMNGFDQMVGALDGIVSGGMVVVPVEPTPEMVNALHAAVEIEVYADESNSPNIANGLDVVRAILQVARLDCQS